MASKKKNAEKEKELYPTEDYANAYVESENGYLITLNNGEQLELPKEDVVKLENDSRSNEKKHHRNTGNDIGIHHRNVGNAFHYRLVVLVLGMSYAE